MEGVISEIANPDFTDLSTALDAVLAAYAFDDARDWELPAKRLAALDLLSRIPALLVVDDIDAVEGQAEAAIEFFAKATLIRFRHGPLTMACGKNCPNVGLAALLSIVN